jgi:hypothetical protein
MKRDISGPPATSLVIAVTPSLERLLAKAAVDRGQTAEALAKQVLYDWLLAERGVTKAGTQSRLGRQVGITLQQ